MSDRRIYRVQDAAGRGPFRPGFSSTWISMDDDARPLLPAVQAEFSNFSQMVASAHKQGKHIGCGARGYGCLSKWFLPDEVERLIDAGFRLVRCHAVEVLAESDNQILFASHKPLHFLPVVNWPDRLIEMVAA